MNEQDGMNRRRATAAPLVGRTLAEAGTMKSDKARHVIAETIETIAADSPDSAVRSVLAAGFPGQAAADATSEPIENKWYELLSSTQEANGNWCRFHRNLRNIPLREAVNKAVGIGLDPGTPICSGALAFATAGLRLPLSKLRDYLLRPGDPCRLWASPAICLAVLANVASRLKASGTILRSAVGQLIDLTRSAYPNGAYNLHAENAHLYEKGLMVRRGGLQELWPATREPIIVEVIGMHASELAADLRAMYFADLWQHLRFYDNHPPASHRTPGDSPDDVAAWFMNHQILSLFPEWRAAASDDVEYLWKRRNDKGLWDFGAPSDSSGVASRLRVSSRWTARSRRHDWSLRALALLTRYYSKGMDWPTRGCSRRRGRRS
jgi:hypothetical protein